MEISEILAAWQTMLDRQADAMARLDVHTIVIGNLLPAFHADTATVARIQAALEVFGETAATKSAPFAAAAAEEIDRYLSRLPKS